MKKSFAIFLLVLMLSTAVLFSAQSIVPVDGGYYYTDSLYSTIYFSNGKQSTELLSAPGAGRFFTISPDEKMIGFKYREIPGGTEAPAIYYIDENKVELLHEPVYLAGQVSFSDDGKIAYTINKELYIKDGSEQHTFDLDAYVNLAPISPNGKKVVFNDEHDQLWLFDLATGSKKEITSNEYGNVFPAWSYDSRFISYSSLDGTVKIFDDQEDLTMNIGHAANFKWASGSDEYVYTEIKLNDTQSDFSSDIVLANTDRIVIKRTNTTKVNESLPFFLQDGSVAAYDDNSKISVIKSMSLKKNAAIDLDFPITPKTFSILAPSTDTYLDVPYVHQVYDTPGTYGYSSCAPTTAAMVMAYYGLLPKWPYVSGAGNTNNYGAYVHERYYYNDNYFNLSYSGSNYTCYGGMGYMWNGGSPNSKMAGYYRKHDVSASQTWNTDWTKVKTEIDKKQPYSICNFLSSGGHLIVGLGRASNGQRTVIANDPYGNRNLSSWPNYSGAVVRYDWPGYNHGHASLNYANSGYTTMPWCIATSYNATASVDSIVDDKQFNHGFYLKAQGTTIPMRYYYSTKSGYKNHHWWTYSEQDQTDVCYAKWTPQVESGYYEIKAYIPANATASSAVYKIHHIGGTESVLIDQSVYSDTLVSLGQYIMLNDGSNFVYLGDSTGVSGEKLAFDAMVWQDAESDFLDFTTDDSLTYPGYELNFYATSTLPKGNYDYLWDFGDGTTAMGDSVVHVFTNTGIYDISLTLEVGDTMISKVKEDHIYVEQNIDAGIELVYPDSMEIVSDARPQLLWKEPDLASGEIVSYYLSYGLTPTCNIDTNNILGNMFRFPIDLPENKTIYWKVYANTSGTPLGETYYSKTGAFKVNAENTLPMSFDLLTPNDGFISDTLRPDFSWEETIDKDPGDAITYKLYIGTHKDSMECLYNGLETSFQLSSDLIENGHYFWYAEAVDRSNGSTRSKENMRELYVNAENEAPLAAVQIAPNHNSYQTTRYPHLEWTAAQDPDPGDEVRYKVYYRKSTSSSYNYISTSSTSYDSRRFSDMSEYVWHVIAMDEHDAISSSDTMVFYTNTELDIVDIPVSFALNSNYPNPFNPVTSISYDLPEAVNAKLSIFDMNGRCVATLINDFHNAGKYSVQFNASGVPSGIYIYKIEAGNFIDSKKMILLK